MKQFTMNTDGSLLQAAKLHALERGRIVSEISRESLASEVGWTADVSPVLADDVATKAALHGFSEGTLTRCLAMEAFGLTSENVGETTVFEALSEGDFGEGPFLFLFEEDRFVDPGFYGRYTVHSTTTMGFLVGLERSKVIPGADAVLDAVRSNGWQSVKRLVIDRPQDRASRGDDLASLIGRGSPDVRSTDPDGPRRSPGRHG